MPSIANDGQFGLRQSIRRLLCILFRCNPVAALALLLSSLIASVSMLVLAPQAPLYAALSAILFLPCWIWPGVLLEGIRAHRRTKLLRRSYAVWTCIACVILIDSLLLGLLEELEDPIRFASVLETVAWSAASALALWVFWTVARVLVEAEDRRQAPATRVIGTFLQFISFRCAFTSCNDALRGWFAPVSEPPMMISLSFDGHLDTGSPLFLRFTVPLGKPGRRYTEHHVGHTG